ncbi:MAG: FTR1 family protein [Alphaproteobacteria bacterium]|nr:FTR1 family protein [Alphaproteobacteria bacterium]
MLETMTIAFREGVEAFLIVAISLAYLVRTGRENLRKPVYWGVACALVCSAVLGIWLEEISDNPLTEGTLAVIAGVMVGTFTIHMLKAAKSMGKDIRDALEAHAQKNGFLAALGVFLFVTLMITREGMETVLMMSAAAYQTTATQIIMGAILGLALAALIAWFWVRKSHLIHIGRFLQVSSIFLVIFSAQLFLYGLHELSETGLVPLLDNGIFHELTENISDDSVIAHLISYSLVAVPFGWLLFVTVKDKLANRNMPAAAQ